MKPGMQEQARTGFSSPLSRMQNGHRPLHRAGRPIRLGPDPWHDDPESPERGLYHCYRQSSRSRTATSPGPPPLSLSPSRGVPCNLLIPLYSPEPVPPTGRLMIVWGFKGAVSPGWRSTDQTSILSSRASRPPPVARAKVYCQRGRPSWRTASSRRMASGSGERTSEPAS